MITFELPLKSNYPNYSVDTITLMPTPERIQAYTDITGAGVTIAFVDSGFSAHPDIADRIMMHVDASTNHIIEQAMVQSTSPMSWHGQMTSVIAAGNGSVSNGHYRGVASCSNLVLIKVSTPDYSVKERDILRGLQWVYDARNRHDIRIVNVSVGGDFPDANPNQPLHRIIRKLHQIGIVVVVAAGNSGRSSLVPPASSADAIVVGGYDDQNSIDKRNWTLYHHNYGSAYDGNNKPDILAPANWIASPLLPGSTVEAEIGVLAQLLKAHSVKQVSSILQDARDILSLTELELENIDFKLHNKLQNLIYHHKVVDKNHQYVDGTSVASPIVTSVVAQMLEIEPKLTPDDIYSILSGTAVTAPQVEDHKQGFGWLNARMAVQAAQAIKISR